MHPDADANPPRGMQGTRESTRLPSLAFVRIQHVRHSSASVVCIRIISKRGWARASGEGPPPSQLGTTGCRPREATRRVVPIRLRSHEFTPTILAAFKSRNTSEYHPITTAATSQNTLELLRGFFAGEYFGDDTGGERASARVDSSSGESTGDRPTIIIRIRLLKRGYSRG